MADEPVLGRSEQAPDFLTLWMASWLTSWQVALRTATSPPSCQTGSDTCPKSAPQESSTKNLGPGPSTSNSGERATCPDARPLQLRCRTLARPQKTKCRPLAEGRHTPGARCGPHSPQTGSLTGEHGPPPDTGALRRIGLGYGVLFVFFLRLRPDHRRLDRGGSSKDRLVARQPRN